MVVAASTLEAAEATTERIHMEKTAVKKLFLEMVDLAK